MFHVRVLAGYGLSIHIDRIYSNEQIPFRNFYVIIGANKNTKIFALIFGDHEGVTSRLVKITRPIDLLLLADVADHIPNLIAHFSLRKRKK